MSDSDTQKTTSTEALLSSVEARILGCLMEKQLTTPDTYPLTLNSLVTACNQKTSREPVMNLQNGEVQRCINELRENALIEVEYGSRADRYHQKLTRQLHFDKAEQAIFTLLLLRGPQTTNELFSRSQRMHNFESVSSLQDLLNKLLGKTTCWLIKLPRQSGQREDRYMHLLCGEVDLESYHANASAPLSTYDDDLVQRVNALEEQVAWLLEQIGSPKQ